MTTIAPIPRNEQRLIQKNGSDKQHVRRLTAMLMLLQGHRVSEVYRQPSIRFSAENMVWQKCCDIRAQLSRD